MIQASIFILIFAELAQGQPHLQFEAVTQSVRVAGLVPGSYTPDRLSAALRVFLGESGTAMLGDYKVDGDSLLFIPRFPLLPGRTYHAVLDLRELSIIAGRAVPTSTAVESLSFKVEAASLASAPRVLCVYPSGDAVPANLLRIYVVFSQAMAQNGVERYIRVLDEAGMLVEHPFFDTKEGLWDPEGRRLTLFFDPGRIKRGLVLHDTLGPPLKSGGYYRLVISREAQDAAGMPLAQEFQKEFRVVAEDRSVVDPSAWIVNAPRNGSREPLIVISGKQLDEPLFARQVRTEDSSGRPVPGEVVIERGGTLWRFVPATPWHRGPYVLRIGADLEDLAGNRPGRLFDEPAPPLGDRKEAREVLLPFRVLH